MIVPVVLKYCKDCVCPVCVLCVCVWGGGGWVCLCVWCVYLCGCVCVCFSLYSQSLTSVLFLKKNALTELLPWWIVLLFIFIFINDWSWTLHWVAVTLRVVSRRKGQLLENVLLINSIRPGVVPKVKMLLFELKGIIQTNTESFQIKSSLYKYNIQIKLRWALFVPYNNIAEYMWSEIVFSALNPSKCTTWAVGQPTVRPRGAVRGLFLPEPCSNPQPRVFKSNALSISRWRPSCLTV